MPNRTIARACAAERRALPLPVLLTPAQYEYFHTLMRVPRDVILAVVAREILLGDGDTCVCGWVLREAIARCAKLAAEQVAVSNRLDRQLAERCNIPSSTSLGDVPALCAAMFGGSTGEWKLIYYGVIDTAAIVRDIELAFMARVEVATWQ